MILIELNDHKSSKPYKISKNPEKFEEQMEQQSNPLTNN